VTREQVVPAFVAALLGEGVSARQIEMAVLHVRSLPLGAPISAAAGRGDDDPLVRSFAFEQAKRLVGAAS
jgi:hypothetical protein